MATFRQATIAGEQMGNPVFTGPSDIYSVCTLLSLVPLIHGKQKTLNRPFLAWWYPHANGHGTQPCQAILKDGWKLVHFMKQDEAELYRLDVDEGERKNLANEQPEMTDALLETLNQWVEATRPAKAEF
ncbi:MAG: arylsulfatase A-like enzyme [Kiritimatiellia bacterium]|jgi:arylsulfatase A-like enzyme